jgi:hypothetical protein
MNVNFEAAALAYAAKGAAVFPLAAGAKIPVCGCKWRDDATPDAAQIRGWAERYPHANVGVACGLPSGFFVLDVDPRNGGDETLRALVARGHAVPPGPRARTGNGGWHLPFMYDSRVKNGNGRLGPGLDVKSSGGYVVGVGSWIAPSPAGPGGPYRWDVSPDQAAIPRAPLWMLSALCPAPRPQRFDERSFSGTGNTAGIERTVREAPEGNGNGALYWGACRMGEAVRAGQIGLGEARARLEAAARPLALRDGAKSVRDTIESGLRRGAS